MGPLGRVPPALRLQKRWRLGAKATKGTQGGIVDGGARMRPRWPMGRPWSGPLGQEGLKGIAASGGGHDELPPWRESIVFTRSMSMGNRKPLTCQN